MDSLFATGSPTIFATVRRVLFATILLFALISLALNAYFISLLNYFRLDGALDFNGLGLTISIITLLLLPAVILIETYRKGAIISLVSVELGWSGVLWLLWLVEGALAARGAAPPDVCRLLTPKRASLCSTWSAIAAFAFLNWLLLLGWFTVILVLAIRGNHWNSSIVDSDLFAHPAPAQPPAPTAAPLLAGQEKAPQFYQPTTPQAQYTPSTPQAHYQYPPSNYPNGAPSPVPHQAAIQV